MKKTLRQFLYWTALVAVIVMSLRLSAADPPMPPDPTLAQVEAPVNLPDSLLSTPVREWQLNGLTIVVLLGVLGRAYKAIRNGGGLRGLWNGLLYGVQSPKPEVQSPPGDLGTYTSSAGPKLILPFLLAGGLLFTSGCATQTGTVNWTSKAKGVSYIVTAKLIQEHPGWSDGFRQASADLKLLSAQPTISLAEVTAIITRLPELQTEDAAIYVNGVVLIFQDELTTLSIKTPEQLRNAAIGLYQGIDLVLPPAS